MSDNHDDTEDFSTPASDRFADALDLCRLAWDSQKTKGRLEKLRKLNRDIAAAEAQLAGVKAQAAGILVAAKAEAERIIKDVEDQTREQRNDLEHRESRLAYGERYSAKLEAARRAAPGGVISMSDEHRIRVQLAEEDAGSINIGALIRRDVGDERSDAQGNAFTPSTLHRDVSHKRRGAQ